MLYRVVNPRSDKSEMLTLVFAGYNVGVDVAFRHQIAQCCESLRRIDGLRPNGTHS
jgi:hypothetical protein